MQRFWATVTALRLQQLPPDRPQRPGEYPELLAFLEAQTQRLHEALSSAGPQEPVYMWADDKTVGYVRRRQAHEALIHRLEAELTVGQVTPLPAELAYDGVLEMLQVMHGCPPWGRVRVDRPASEHRRQRPGLAVPVALGRFTGTDPEDHTTYDEDEVSLTAADPSREPEVVVRGTAEDLDAWMWGRGQGRDVAIEGNRRSALASRRC